jgi:hypothetical protein
LGYESLQAKAYNEPHYDCGRPNGHRRRSHNRASNMAFAERQDARSSNYRQSTRLTRTEVDRDSPRHIDDAERLRCDANDYFAVGTVPPSRDTPRQIRRLNMEQLPANIGSRSRKRPFTRTAAPDPHVRRSRLLLRHLKAGQSSHTLRLPDRCRRSLPDA